MQFYSECRKLKPIEVVTRPGDVLFVPRGWWHTALNFDYCVAITQNYAPSSSMLGVVDWLEAHPQNASGTRVGGAELAACLRGALHAQRPGLLEQQQAVREQKMFGATQKTFRFGFFGE
jgi:ribosomal protein L16 Arg81 hydroxylase